MFWDVSTALLLRILRANQVVSLFLSYTSGMEEKLQAATRVTSMAVTVSRNQTLAPYTISSLFAKSFMTKVNRHRKPILCKLFQLRFPQSTSLANPSGRTASICSSTLIPFQVSLHGSFLRQLPQAMRFCWKKEGPLIPSILLSETVLEQLI